MIVSLPTLECLSHHFFIRSPPFELYVLRRLHALRKENEQY